MRSARGSAFAAARFGPTAGLGAAALGAAGFGAAGFDFDDDGLRAAGFPAGTSGDAGGRASLRGPGAGFPAGDFRFAAGLGKGGCADSGACGLGAVGSGTLVRSTGAAGLFSEIGDDAGTDGRFFGDIKIEPRKTRWAGISTSRELAVRRGPGSPRSTPNPASGPMNDPSILCQFVALRLRAASSARPFAPSLCASAGRPVRLYRSAST